MSPTNEIESGIVRQGDSPPAAPAGTRDARLNDQQAIEGAESDDLGAASEQAMRRKAARSTPPMGDVRSDAGAGAGPGNGEPL